jgi:hypothetical protein
MATPTSDQRGIYDASAAYNGVTNEDRRTSLLSPLSNKSSGLTPTSSPHIDISEPLTKRDRDTFTDAPSSRRSESASKEKGTKSRKTTLSSGRTQSSSFFSQESWIPSRNASGFLLTVFIEAVVVIGLLVTVFVRILVSTRCGQRIQGSSNLHLFQGRTHSDDRVQDLKTVAVYFSLLIFGMIFLVLIALDAHRLKNTIQVVSRGKVRKRRMTDLRLCNLDFRLV